MVLALHRRAGQGLGGERRAGGRGYLGERGQPGERRALGELFGAKDSLLQVRIKYGKSFAERLVSY